MSKLYFVILLIVVGFSPVEGFAIGDAPYIQHVVQKGDFQLVNHGKATSLVIDTDDYAQVIRAVGDLQHDIQRVAGVLPSIKASLQHTERQMVLIGTIGKSPMIDRLIANHKLNVDSVKGKWEGFTLQVIDHPLAGIDRALVIAGSDKRGTIYGIYDLSEQIGVSPWYWWADVKPIHQSVLAIQSNFRKTDWPAVKYRGIFINDEEPSFGGWARHKFGGINSKMYAHVFELLLRLKGNYLWPAMWGKSFNEDDPENPVLANKYGIVMGTSHHEPMMRSQNEWNVHHKEYGNGEWNYSTNSAGLKKFWKDGLERNKDYDNLVTIGMRGNGDMPMVSAGDDQKNIKLLEKIISGQRKIIAEVTKKAASQTPQVWALYSEVQKYYDEGMKVPDDVIILLCDDNWGDVRRLPEIGEPKHAGGYGMYYHVDLHGAPRSYQWLNMTQIPHMWEQLQLTYSYGVNKIWMLNVGDIKPMEYPITFFMDMAWNPDSFNAGNLQHFAVKFCKEQFGAARSVEAADILSTYCKYNSRVTAEMLNQHTYNLESGEFRQVRDAYLSLETRALRQFLTLPDAYKDAYNELILFPVQAMANLYDLYYSVAMNKKYALEKDLRANYWADHAEYCFKRDSVLTYNYNHKIAEGKWNHMMDQVHIGYTSWDAPRTNIMPEVVRINPNDTEQGGYLFREKDGVVAMEAEHYFTSKANAKTQWTVIPDLGRTLSGLALMPYTEQTTGALLNYKMKLTTQPDSVKLRIIFNATLPFKKGGESVTAAFDGEKGKTWNINDQLTWKNNYTKMYPAAAARIIESEVTLPLKQTSDGVHLLEVSPLEPGVVFEKLIIDDGGYEHTFLKMPESPYERQ